MEPIRVAFKAHLGWINSVAVRADANEPLPMFAMRLDLLDLADREAAEPYHVAGGWHGLERKPRPANPEQVIKRGREKQATSTLVRLQEFQVTVLQRFDWIGAVMLTSRGRLGDLENILNSHAQIHVAEGEAIRDATRAAFTELSIPFTNLDEKSIPDLAHEHLGIDNGDALMKERRPADARSWRKEERTIALGAWLGQR